MDWAPILVAISGWALAVALLILLPSRARQAARQTSLRVRSHVEPYLLRRAAELRIDPPPEASTPAGDAGVIIDGICDLADRLTEHERNQVALGDTMNIAVSDTMPLTTGKLLEGQDLDD